MPDQIGLNHILNLDNFCFCLLCKKKIPENNSLNKETTICAHIKSEEHYINSKALFKICFPDYFICEGDDDDIKYANILRNLKFDVSWELGHETCYVRISDNTISCLICEKDILKTFKDEKKPELTLASHLESELHLSEVKSNVSWMHHPSEDDNYIGFHEFSIFCSYCQKYLKSPDNTLLKTAAKHITIELEIKARERKRDQSFHISNEIEDDIQQESQTSKQKLKRQKKIKTNEIEDCFQQESEMIIVSGLEIEDCIQQESEFDADLKSIKHLVHNCNKFRDLLDDIELDIKKDVYVQKYQTCKRSVPPSSTYNKNSKGLKVIWIENVSAKRLLRTVQDVLLNQTKVLTQIVDDCSLIRLNKMYVEIKDNRFFCILCKIFTQFDEKGNTLRRHMLNDHNDVLIQRASDFILKTNFGGKYINLTNTNEEFEKFSVILKDIALDKKFISHITFIENNGQDFVCILCKVVIPFTNCGKTVEQHFFQTGHLQKTFDISITRSLVKEQRKKHNLKTNRISKKSKPQTDIKNLALFFNINGFKLQPNIKKVQESCKIVPSNQDSDVMKRRLLKILRLSSEENIEVRMNLQFLIMKDDNIFCTACQTLIKHVNSGFSLLKHCTSITHNQALTKMATDYLMSNNLKPICAKFTKSDFISLREVTKFDPRDFIAPHLLFLIITNNDFITSPSWLSCHLCNEPIEFVTVCGVKDHLLSNQHRRKTYELSCKSLDFKQYGDRQPSNFEEIESFKYNYTGQLKDSSDINKGSQKKSNQSVDLSGLLEKAEDCLPEVVESNKLFLEVKNQSLCCTLCKKKIERKKKAMKLQSIVDHFNNKTHRKTKKTFEEVLAFENKCSPNPDFQLGNEICDSKNCSGQHLVFASSKCPNPRHKDGKECNQNNNELLIFIPKTLPDKLKQYENLIELSGGLLFCKRCKLGLLWKNRFSNPFLTLQRHFNNELYILQESNC